MSVHVKTDRGATHEDDGEGSQDASNAHQPGHPEEKDHPQDVLHTWQVHAHYRAHTWSLSIKQSTNQSIIRTQCKSIDWYMLLNIIHRRHN